MSHLPNNYNHSSSGETKAAVLDEIHF